jgi:hypothetical protein
MTLGMDVSPLFSEMIMVSAMAVHILHAANPARAGLEHARLGGEEDDLLVSDLSRARTPRDWYALLGHCS